MYLLQSLLFTFYFTTILGKKMSNISTFSMYWLYLDISWGREIFILFCSVLVNRLGFTGVSTTFQIVSNATNELPFQRPSITSPSSENHSPYERLVVSFNIFEDFRFLQLGITVPWYSTCTTQRFFFKSTYKCIGRKEVIE